MRKIIKTGIIAFVFTLAFNINPEWAGSYTPKNFTENTVAETVSLSNAPFLQTAYAQETDSPKSADPEMIKKAANAAIYINRVFYPLINFFAFHIGNFLGSDYIFEGNMGEMLNKIWVVSRNIVNILFVIILLYFALKQIFPGGKDEGSGKVKEQLVFIALFLVAVNFSWLMTKVVLDAANVTTNVVFSLPSGVASTGIEEIIDESCEVTSKGTDGEGTNTTKGGCMPTVLFYVAPSEEKENVRYMNDADCKSEKIGEKYQGKPDSAFDAAGEKNPNASPDNKEYQNKTTYCWDKINFFNYNKNTSAIYLVYGMGQIQKMIYSTADTDSGTQFGIGVLFSLFINAAYTLSLLALFLALIFRMAMLWIFVAFSPFLVLMWYFNKSGLIKAPESINSKLSTNAFLNWAFVPTYVGAIFSVAFIMLAVGNAGSSKINYGANFFNSKSVFAGLDGIQEFIWLLLVLVILWMGVFGILGKLDVVGKFTDIIKTAGTTTATTIGKSPLSLPLAPMVDEKGNFGMQPMYKGLKAIGIDTHMEKEYATALTGDETSRIAEKAKIMTDDGKKDIVNLAAAGKMEEVARKFDISVDKLRSNQAIIFKGFDSEQIKAIGNGFEKYDKPDKRTEPTEPPKK